MASSKLGRLYPRGKSPIPQDQSWARRSEEKSPSLRLSGSNPGRPARSQAPFRLSYLAHEVKKYYEKKNSFLTVVSNIKSKYMKFGIIIFYHNTLLLWNKQSIMIKNSNSNFFWISISYYIQTLEKRFMSFKNDCKIKRHTHTHTAYTFSYFMYNIQV